MSKKALMIDGNSLIYRSFYATLNQLNYYKEHQLQPVNALKLVLQIVLKLIQNEHYDYALFALDHQKKTLRHETFAEYKAGRKPMPEDLVSQLPLIRDAVESLGINVLSMPGIEADDIIGSCAKLMNDQQIFVDAYTSDRDLLQLVNDYTTIKLFKTGISDIQTINLQNFAGCFHNLKPSQVVDFKGISGDSSDNLCGVKGIGPKNAEDLINKYGSLENIYAHIYELTPNQQVKFANCKEMAMMCKHLSTIQLNVLSNSIDDFTKKPINYHVLNEIINHYQFHGLEKYLENK